MSFEAVISICIITGAKAHAAANAVHRTCPRVAWKRPTTNERNGRFPSKAEMITTWIAFHALGYVALHFPTQLGEIRDTHARLALWGLACDADHAHSPDGPFSHREAVRMRYKVESPPRLLIDLCHPGELGSGAEIAAYRTSGMKRSLVRLEQNLAYQSSGSVNK